MWGCFGFRAGASLFVSVSGNREDGSFPYARLLVWQDGCREETVRTENLEARLRRCPFPFMLFSGYREAPAFMAQYTGHAAVQTVIFQTQEECEDWLLEDRRLETVYVGEIRTTAGRSDICVLFFSLRESPGTIFVFPTLGCIRENLFGGTRLQARCVEADDRMFLRVFAALGDEVQIMRYLTGLMEMLLGRRIALDTVADWFGCRRAGTAAREAPAGNEGKRRR